MTTTPSMLEILLEQHSVTGVGGLIAGLGEDANLEACALAIARFDQEGQSSPGLLVHRVREAAKVRAAVSSMPVEGKLPVTERLLQAVRGSCRSPDGFTREMAHDLFADAAKKRGLPADELIDRAMGADWVETLAEGDWPGAPAAARLAEERGEERVIHPARMKDVGGLRKLSFPTGKEA